jgi:dienelactone hydrolase
MSERGLVAEVVLFHHVHGLTEGVRAFAEELGRAGHTIHTPDLYEGNVFVDRTDGFAYVEALGFGAIIERGAAAAAGLPTDIVYAGFSLGVLPAQMLAQTKPYARGALLLHSTIPVEGFGTWPADLPAQIHGMDGDPFFVGDGDIEVARELAASFDGVELFLYSGDSHLFADSSLPGYDEEAADLMMDRIKRFLLSVDDRTQDAAAGS